jgi:hypothetical protein
VLQHLLRVSAHLVTQLPSAYCCPSVPDPQLVYKKANKVLPDDPWEQLRMGIDAVFRCESLPRLFLSASPLVLSSSCLCGCCFRLRARGACVV